MLTIHPYHHWWYTPCLRKHFSQRSRKLQWSHKPSWTTCFYFNGKEAWFLAASRKRRKYENGNKFSESFIDAIRLYRLERTFWVVSKIKSKRRGIFKSLNDEVMRFSMLIIVGHGANDFDHRIDTNGGKVYNSRHYCDLPGCPASLQQRSAKYRKIVEY